MCERWLWNTGSPSHASPSHRRSSISRRAYSMRERCGSMSSMRSSHRPPLLLAESHDSSALNTLPRCIRPVGEGAKRPVVIIFKRQSYEKLSAKQKNLFFFCRDGVRN